MVVFTVFEFIRKPWEGREQEIEKAIQQQANNIFDSISSYEDFDRNLKDNNDTYSTVEYNKIIEK